MDVFGAVFGLVISLFRMEFTVYGFTLNLWSIMLYASVAGIIFWGLGQLFGGD